MGNFEKMQENLGAAQSLATFCDFEIAHPLWNKFILP
jgi:hypothetical protein